MPLRHFCTLPRHHDDGIGSALRFTLTASILAPSTQAPQKKTIYIMSTQNTPINEEDMASLCASLRASFTNMSAAIKCSICQSSYDDPVQLPCVHVYCRDCIQHLLPNKCPICKAHATRRSITDCEYMKQMVQVVKNNFRVFGFTPVAYDSTVVAMTQQVNNSSEAAGSLEEIQEFLNISRIQHYFMQDNGSHLQISDQTKSWKQQQATVVRANLKALQEARGNMTAPSQESFY
jgi:hypothetical protein